MSESPVAPPKISKQKAIETLWRKGILHWKLDENQKVMNEFCLNKKDDIIVIGSSRRIGKTYFLVVLGAQTCLAKPNQIVKFIAPTVKDIKRIIAPLIKQITADCPRDLVPKYNTQDHVYRFANGSEIQLAGTDNGRAESIRGNDAHLCIIDEAGFCDDLEYIVTSILLPSVSLTGGKIVMSSTPPRSPDHPFMGFMAKAEASGAFIKRTIYDNPRLNEEKISKIADAIGGKESVDFKREYLVEMITSEDDAVVPEFSSELQKDIVIEKTPPPFYDTYVSMDIGGRDFTAILFGYYDFLLGAVVIQDELVFKGKEILTDNIARQIKQVEAKLWTHKLTGDVKPVSLRVADNNNLILLNDLSSKHGISFVPTLKDNKDAAINNMRMMVRNGRVLINPRCKNLIYHLKAATWKKDRSNFTRSVDGGHWDFIPALYYLLRNINENKNPYPRDYQFHGTSAPIFYNNQETKNTKFEDQISDAFKVKRGKRFR